MDLNTEDGICFFVGCVLVRPIYYQGRWVSLPLLNYNNVIPMQLQNRPPSPYKRSCRARNEFCLSLKETLIPKTLDEEVLWELCKLHSIPLRWVMRCEDWKLYKKRGEAPRRRKDDEKKNKPLQLNHYKKILVELKKIDAQSALVCEILWIGNRGRDVVEFNGYISYLTLEEVLHLQIEQIPLEGSDDAGWLTFIDHSPRAEVRAKQLPKRLWNALCKHVRSRWGFAFSTIHGSAISCQQINDHIQLAAKQSGLRNDISSLSFRSYAFKEIDRCTVNINEIPIGKDPLDPLDPDEWIGLISKFPKIVKGRGRKSVYDLRDICNAILFLLKNRCSFSLLPETFPPRDAVMYRYKCWKRSGVLDEICRYRSR